MRAAGKTKALLRREAVVLAGLVVTVALLAQQGTRDFALADIAVQLVLFGAIACVPAWRTGRMSYVDIAWPLGLVALGALTLAFGGGSSFAITVAVMYLFMGGRMAIGAVAFWRRGEFDQELPRYRYQRLRWERASFGSERRDLIAEVLVQLSAYVSFLAVPAALAVATDPDIGAIGVIGAALWVVSYALESVADVQKLKFAPESKEEGVKRSCDVGLWRYSRHPNYFFQWMQWTAIVVLCAPAAVELLEDSAGIWAAITAAGLLGTTGSMYWCLVHYTGAVPAEHYSVRSRADYRAYQARTNRFLPGPPR